MALFNRKNKKTNVLLKYVKESLKDGKTIDSARELLENNKVSGNYTTEDIDKAIQKFKDDIKWKDIEKQLKKLPRREQNISLKLLKEYEEGKILKIEKAGN